MLLPVELNGVRTISNGPAQEKEDLPNGHLQLPSSLFALPSPLSNDSSIPNLFYHLHYTHSQRLTPTTVPTSLLVLPSASISPILLLHLHSLACPLPSRPLHRLPNPTPQRIHGLNILIPLPPLLPLKASALFLPNQGPPSLQRPSTRTENDRSNPSQDKPLLLLVLLLHRGEDGITSCLLSYLLLFLSFFQERRSSPSFHRSLPSTSRCSLKFVSRHLLLSSRFETWI